MFENISKKQEKVQEKIQKQQERNDKDCRELTDEELEQVVGGTKAVGTVQLMTGGTQDAQVAPTIVGVIYGAQGLRTEEN